MELFVPRQPDPFIKRARDQEIAKFGHLNALVREVNNLILNSGVLTIVAGAGITVNSTDPQNPIISAAGGSQNLSQVLATGNDAGNQDAINFRDISLFGTLYDEGGTGFQILTAGALTLNIGTASTWAFSDDLTITGTNIDMSGIGVLTAGTGGIKTDIINNATAADLVITGTTNSNIFKIYDGGGFLLETKNNGNLDLAIQGTGIITMNAAPTYTGTVAGSAGLNIVNGLVMA